MVRLKEAFLNLSSDITSFQFQYGAIEGMFIQCLHESGEIFQFQYGAIEGSLKRIPFRFFGYFNSSMVRLKVVNSVL